MDNILSFIFIMTLIFFKNFFVYKYLILSRKKHFLILLVFFIIFIISLLLTSLFTDNKKERLLPIICNIDIVLIFFISTLKLFANYFNAHFYEKFLNRKNPILVLFEININVFYLYLLISVLQLLICYILCV